MWTNLTAAHCGGQLCTLTRPPPSLFMVLQTLISRLTVGLSLLSAGVLEDHPSDPAGRHCCDSNWKHGRNLSAAPTDTNSAVVIEDLASSSTSTITTFFFRKDGSKNTQDQSHLAFCLTSLVFFLTSLVIIINVKIKVNHWDVLSCRYCFVCLLEHQGPSEQQGFKDPVGPRWPFGYHWLWHGEKDPRTFADCARSCWDQENSKPSGESLDGSLKLSHVFSLDLSPDPRTLYLQKHSPQLSYVSLPTCAGALSRGEALGQEGAELLHRLAVTQHFKRVSPPAAALRNDGADHNGCQCLTGGGWGGANIRNACFKCTVCERWCVEVDTKWGTSTA